MVTRRRSSPQRFMSCPFVVLTSSWTLSTPPRPPPAHRRWRLVLERHPPAAVQQPQRLPHRRLQLRVAPGDHGAGSLRTSMSGPRPRPRPPTPRSRRRSRRAGQRSRPRRSAAGCPMCRPAHPRSWCPPGGRFPGTEQIRQQVAPRPRSLVDHHHLGSEESGHRLGPGLRSPARELK